MNVKIAVLNKRIKNNILKTNLKLNMRNNFFLIITSLFIITGCSDFSDEQEVVIKEFLNTSFYGQKEGEFSKEPFYNYVKLSFTLGEDNELRYTYTGRAYASYMNTRYKESGDVKISYSEDGYDHIEIELISESGESFRTIDFVIEKDSIVKRLKQRTLDREIIRSFKDDRKIQQSYNSLSESIEENSSGSSRTLLSYLWNEDYKSSTEYIGDIYFNQNTGRIDLMEEYDESMIDRPSFYFNDNLEKNEILKFLKNGFEIYDTNIYDKKGILSSNEVYSSIPISPDEHNYPYHPGYENEFPGDDLKFLYDDTWDFGFMKRRGSSGYPRSRVVSINDPSVKKKYVGLKKKWEYNDFGIAFSTWIIEVSLKTSHENSEFNIIDSYKIFEIWNSKNREEKYLLLMRKYLTSPYLGTDGGYGGFNNDYIILKTLK